MSAQGVPIRGCHKIPFSTRRSSRLWVCDLVLVLHTRSVQERDRLSIEIRAFLNHVPVAATVGDDQLRIGCSFQQGQPLADGDELVARTPKAEDGAFQFAEPFNVIADASSRPHFLGLVERDREPLGHRFFGETGGIVDEMAEDRAEIANCLRSSREPLLYCVETNLIWYE